jgi:hypothetical protein
MPAFLLSIIKYTVNVYACIFSKNEVLLRKTNVCQICT